MIKLVVTIKNRTEHFLQSIPFLLSQYGADYELVIVDYYSNDNFNDVFDTEINKRKPTYSKFLKSIYKISLKEDLKFNLKKAKNLGLAFFKDYDNNSIVCFSDIDTFISMNYLSFWSEKTFLNKTFCTSRKQESMACLPSRIQPEINNGNCFIHIQDFIEIGGYDESMLTWGGDDDDLYHRLKLKGLREINPYNSKDALQYSILHGEELRLASLEVKERAPKEETFNKIYSQKTFFNENSNFLNEDFAKSLATINKIYEK
jgi:predicted glycosyltransferase involved in capsule biosynthesis